MNFLETHSSWTLFEESLLTFLLTSLKPTYSFSVNAEIWAACWRSDWKKLIVIFFQNGLPKSNEGLSQIFQVNTTLEIILQTVYSGSNTNPVGLIASKASWFGATLPPSPLLPIKVSVTRSRVSCHPLLKMDRVTDNCSFLRCELGTYSCSSVRWNIKTWVSRPCLLFLMNRQDSNVHWWVEVMEFIERSLVKWRRIFGRRPTSVE